MKTGVLAGNLDEQSSRLSLPASAVMNHESFPCLALVDSGCEQNLIDKNLVHQLNLPTQVLPTLIGVTTLGGLCELQPWTFQPQPSNS
ncbi:hypothetical protein CHARACLAT_014724 [Characodon lateralis]|uniref:Peptidase A2 domain-containing protein n=1 Tax=Characodon lateralis TaxID=208331 RepID=A0ABU7ELU9_9TELE|nr:hypothetical protein [Characodon lateralis]